MKTYILMACVCLSSFLYAQQPSVMIPDLDYVEYPEYGNWEYEGEYFISVPIVMDQFVDGIDSFAFNVAYNPQLVTPFEHINIINDPNYILIQNYQDAVSFAMVNGVPVTTSVHEVTDDESIITVRFKGEAAFTNGIHGNCNGLLMYLPFQKSSPCVAGSYSFQFSDGKKGEEFVNPDVPHAFVFEGTQTFSTTEETMVAAGGTMTAPDYQVLATQVEQTLEASVENGIAPFVFVWNNGEEEQNISPDTEGEYYVVATDVRGCVDSSQAILFTPDGVNALSAEKLPLLYPNPAQDYLIIDFPESLVGEMQLVDLQGQLISQKTLEGIREYWNVSELQAGTYLLRVVSDEGNAVSKVTIR